MNYPKFTKRLYDRHITSGHSVRLEANVRGVPEPTIQWYKDGLPVIGTDRIRVSYLISLFI